MDRLEFKAIRRHLGYSQAALGEVMGLRGITIRRYEMPETANNHRPISQHVARFVRLLDYLGRKEMDRIMSKIDPP